MGNQSIQIIVSVLLVDRILMRRCGSQDTQAAHQERFCHVSSRCTCRGSVMAHWHCYMTSVTSRPEAKHCMAPPEEEDAAAPAPAEAATAEAATAAPAASAAEVAVDDTVPRTTTNKSNHN